jgi:flagellar hook-associated protein 2
MAEGILGLGSSGSTGLSQEMIDKLKAAEEKAYVEPFDDDLENWDLELEKITEIESLVSSFQSAVEAFNLFSSSNNAFDQVLASSSGTSAVFDAYDASGLEEGSTTITVTQLAQRDVFQTSKFSDADALVAGGQDSGDKLTITVGGETLEFSTEGKTYAELAEEMNLYEELIVSVEQVNGTESRIVIKGAESGLDNALSIQQDGVDLGLGGTSERTVDMSSIAAGYGGLFGETEALNQELSLSQLTLNGDTIDFGAGAIITYQNIIDEINALGDYTATSNFDDTTKELTISVVANDGSSLTISEVGDGDGNSFLNDSHVSVAQNMKAQIDGIDYDISSNTVTIQGNLTMTAVELGQSTISIQKDNSQILPGVQAIVDAYNELNDYINAEIYDADSPIEDTSSLKMMMSSIKDSLFGSYGEDGDLNLFNYGLSTDLNGYLTLDTATFADALGNDPDTLKNLLVGTAENEGLGTVLTEYVDGLDSYEGLLTLYGENMADRKTTLEEEKEKAQETIDTRYELMAQQFAAYTAIITQMENSFSGLKMMIQQSTSSN